MSEQNIDELASYIDLESSSRTDISTFLSELSDELIQEDDTISLIAFQNFLNLPLVITEKLFNALTKSSSAMSLSHGCFIQGITSLYSQDNIGLILELLFNLFDFDQDGIIHIQDILLLAYHFHYYGKAQPAIESLEGVIHKGFLAIEDNVDITYSVFTNHIKKHNSDIVFLFLMFFFKYKPFTKSAFAYYMNAFNINQHKEEGGVKCEGSNMRNGINNINDRGLYQLKEPTEALFNYINHAFDMDFIYHCHSNSIEEEEGEDQDDSSLMDELSAFEDDLRTVKERYSQSSTGVNRYSFNNRVSNPELFKQRLSFCFSNTIPDSFILTSPIKDINTNANTSTTNSNSKYNHTPSLALIKPNEDMLLYHFKSKIKCNINGKMITFKLTLIDNIVFINEKHKRGKEQLINQLYLLHNILEVISTSFIYENRTYYQVLIYMKAKETPYEFALNFLSENDQSMFIKKVIDISGFTRIKDHYDITQEKIGSGNFGSVCLGYDRKTKEKVAIKIIDQKDISLHININSKNPLEDLTSLRWEVDISKLVSRTNHDNLIKVISIYESLEYVYIVMEYAPITLINYLATIKECSKEKQFNQKLNVLSQTVNALAVLHKMGVIHRDIKLDNLVIVKTSLGIPIIKLIDFGLSKVMGYNDKTNEIFGTISYMSPETVSGTPYGLKGDIWSIGVLAHYLLKESFPFISKDTSQNVNNVIRKIQTKKIFIEESDYQSDSEMLLACIINHCLEQVCDRRLNVLQLKSLLERKVI